MHLKTDRLDIRPFLPDDIEDTYEIYSNKDVCKYLLEDAWEYENLNCQIKLDFLYNSEKLGKVFDNSKTF